MAEINKATVCILFSLAALLTSGSNCQHQPKAQSWDQENLHNLGSKHCPAVYDAPDGVIRFCL